MTNATVEDDHLLVIDTATNTIVGDHFLGVHPAGVAVSADGKLVYVAGCKLACIDGTLLALDAATAAIVFQVPLAAAPTGLRLAPDGSRAYVPNTRAATVGVVDLRQGHHHLHRRATSLASPSIRWRLRLRRELRRFPDRRDRYAFGHDGRERRARRSTAGDCRQPGWADRVCDVLRARPLRDRPLKSDRAGTAMTAHVRRSVAVTVAAADQLRHPGRRPGGRPDGGPGRHQQPRRRRARRRLSALDWCASIAPRNPTARATAARPRGGFRARGSAALARPATAQRGRARTRGTQSLRAWRIAGARARRRASDSG